MAVFTPVVEAARDAMRRLVDGEGEGLAARVMALEAAELESLIGVSAELANLVETVQSVTAGVVAEKSRREFGHSGFAQERGFRTPQSFVQSITGGSREQVRRVMRVGETLLGAAGIGGEESAVTDDSDRPGSSAVEPWYAGVARRAREGRLTPTQLDAIRRGLDEPVDGADDAWAAAAEQLADEAPTFTADDLLRRARAARDLLDPEGAARRAGDRYDARSIRTYRTADGTVAASIRFDDESGAFWEAVRNAALRPRRGGPRFVDSEEKAAAEDLQRDPRTNEQLEFDLFMDLLRGGALADAASVFGARQAGVRILLTAEALDERDEEGRMVRIGRVEDGGDHLPPAQVERILCQAGHQEVVVDVTGRPLDVGREQRLYTPRQRIALAVRDGGCIMPGCDRPPSFCEAHHIDEWFRHRGRTDIDRGVLLCVFHHVHVHTTGARIELDQSGHALRAKDGSITRLRSQAMSGVDSPWRRIADLARATTKRVSLGRVRVGGEAAPSRVSKPGEDAAGAA
jgi:hypothetical protein